MPYPTKRDYSWLVNKTDSPLPLLEDAERVTLPREVRSEIVPTFDALGWDRAAQAVAVNFTSVANVDSIGTDAVPAERLRFIFDVSLQTTNPAATFNVWFEHRVAATSLDLGLMLPFTMSGVTTNVKVSPGRTIIMAPFDFLKARTSALTGAGFTLSIRIRYVDIPIGEYIPPR